jgi:hypothetical protein
VRFIDIREQKVITLSNVYMASMKYVALSYVWGSSQKLVLSKSNINELGKKGALALENVSATIADAMILADKLGFTHMWCDALCILQDDESDKEICLAAMASIYRVAYVTFVATAGLDSNAGLPGVRPGTRCFEQEEFVAISPSTSPSGSSTPGISFLTTLACPDESKVSKWSTRGWTMQEMFLSRRLLIFTDQFMKWECNRSCFTEETHLEPIKTAVDGSMTLAQAVLWPLKKTIRSNA